MRSFEQREFVPLFQKKDEREAQSRLTESAEEMPQLILRLARSIESLTRAVLRVNSAEALIDQPGRTTLLLKDPADRSLDLVV